MFFLSGINLCGFHDEKTWVRKKRIQEYVEFLKKQLGYVTEDEEYFKLLNMEIERDTGINVLRELDIEIKED